MSGGSEGAGGCASVGGLPAPRRHAAGGGAGGAAGGGGARAAAAVRRRARRHRPPRGDASAQADHRDGEREAADTVSANE